MNIPVRDMDVLKNSLPANILKRVLAQNVTAPLVFSFQAFTIDSTFDTGGILVPEKGLIPLDRETTTWPNKD